MQLNNIDLISYEPFEENRAVFVLDCTFEEATTLDGELLNITNEQGEIIASLGGYNLSSLERIDNYTRAIFVKILEPNTKQTIIALQNNLKITQDNVQKNADIINDQINTSIDHEKQITLLGDALEELIALTLGGE